MFATIALLLTILFPPQDAVTPGLTPGEQAVAVMQGDDPAAHAEAEHEYDIMHHLQDAHSIDTPFGVIDLPAPGSWMVGPIDMTPTKHVVFMWFAALIVIGLFFSAAAAARKRGGAGAPRKGHNVMEALVLFLRDQVVMPNVGSGGERFVPFVVTLFFFILTCNLLGLVPWGATATGNISVTAALAIMSFVAIEYAGMRALGPKGYLGTIVYIPKGLPAPLVPIMAVIMTPVELLGKLTKPFALAIRLFANLTAGHVLLLAIIGLIFVFGSYTVLAGPVIMAVAITFLEIFVAFLQAYIFALLTSVFIGLIRHAH